MTAAEECERNSSDWYVQLLEVENQRAGNAGTSRVYDRRWVAKPHGKVIYRVGSKAEPEFHRRSLKFSRICQVFRFRVYT